MGWRYPLFLASGTLTGLDSLQARGAGVRGRETIIITTTRARSRDPCERGRVRVFRPTYLSRSALLAVGMRYNSRLHATSALGPATLIRAMARLDATLPCTLEPE